MIVSNFRGNLQKVKQFDKELDEQRSENMVRRSQASGSVFDLVRPGLSLPHTSPKNQSDFTIQIFYEGTLIKTRRVTEGKNFSGGGVRGKASFSASSRRRLMQKLAQIKRDCLPTFLTLTYPGEYSDNPKIWKRDLDVFSKALHYKFPDAGWIWKLEPQKRGAPHYHFLIWGLDDSWENKAWVSAVWFRSVGSGDESHLKAGTRLEKIRSWAGVKSYASKYLGKITELFINNPEGVGRFWGVRYKENVPFSDNFIFNISYKEAHYINRVLQSYKMSNYRKKAQGIHSVLDKEKKLLISLENSSSKNEKIQKYKVEITEKIKNLKMIQKNCFRLSKRQKFRWSDSVIVNSGDFWLGVLGDLRRNSGVTFS